MTLWKRLWRDERGGMEALGVILMYSIVVFGAVTGLVALRNQIVQEYGDVAAALDHLDQSWHASSIGKGYSDPPPTLDDPPNAEPAKLNVRLAPPAEGGALPPYTP
jgi:hypothetical protein